MDKTVRKRVNVLAWTRKGEYLIKHPDRSYELEFDFFREIGRWI